ncbi:MCT family MFS transporter KNAG_0I02170 [Huiozyma naganishii CBS 8797]|uniref:Major facilitator superfamily (MFS) profile domain-containing protein n=1 Tax=Huiozyma naganishii (strain ATCC MYA-139 / BCRC 22969 / CBS 8797 / KCTC 17520 / NBRC 10181 / NCYC 3082 / Yp74L-3) TaxID=1071383 RepID=J7RQF6_HUIN7|nr:hypothetical protein KNAG_0I02170 [Kazachstania naganishii CBS 8797]CCK72003.1 hypothetical protein KNAG_0I02170 [Kazachstania naganishii CBS 8797]
METHHRMSHPNDGRIQAGASNDVELYSMDSNQSAPNVQSIYSDVEGMSIHSKGLNQTGSLGTGVLKSVSHLWKTVTGEGAPEEDTSPKQLNELLVSRFDLGDAIRYQTNDDDFSHDSDEDVEATRNHVHPNKKEYDVESIKDAFEDRSDASDVETLRKVFTNKSTGQLELPPDKGYAWVVVFSVFLVMFNTWGCNAAFGVFLSFFLSNGTFKGATKYDYALIAGLPVALGQGLAPLSMITMRIIGIKQTMLVGTAIMLTGFLWASFAKELWELYVSQGVFIGLSLALIAIPPTTCLPGWFLKKRAMSMGLSLLGTGLGGLTFGLATNKMISDNGNTRWCYRMLAITCTSAVMVSIALVKERIPVKPVGFRSRKAILNEFRRVFDVNVIRRPQVILVGFWFVLAIFAYCLMVFTLSAYAVARGMSQHQGSILTSILNAGQTVGRPSIGFAGDRFGRINVTSILTFVLCIFMFAFWIPANSFIQLIFFSIMVGCCVGVANVMNTVLIADMVAPHEFLPAWAFVNYSGIGLFLTCELIAQALVDPSRKSNPYLHTQIFTGCCFVGALLLSLVLRELSVHKRTVGEYTTLKDKLEPATSTNASLTTTTEKVERKRERCEWLLGPGARKYFRRMFYRTKI